MSTKQNNLDFGNILNPLNMRQTWTWCKCSNQMVPAGETSVT